MLALFVLAALAHHCAAAAFVLAAGAYPVTARIALAYLAAVRFTKRAFTQVTQTGVLYARNFPTCLTYVGTIHGITAWFVADAARLVTVISTGVTRSHEMMVLKYV